MGRWPFLWPAAGMAAGILIGRFSAVSSSSVFLALFFSLPFLWFFRGKRLFLPLFFLALTGIGILRFNQVSKLPRHHLIHFADAAWTSLEGKVTSLPELKEKGKRRIYSFVLESENLVRRKEFFETTGKVQVFLFNPNQSVSYGNRVRLWGMLKQPKSPNNPGEFDYQRFLAVQGIHAVFEGFGPRSIKVIQPVPSLLASPLLAVQNLRDICGRRLDSLFSYPTSALLKALILGVRKDLPEAFRDDFAKTGTTHLIAISGMNITLAAGSLFFLGICVGLPQKGAAMVGLFATIGYVFLSGAGIPVVRAGWMAGLFFIGILVEREKDLLNSLFFAFFAILLFDPQALFQVGFQLSFLSVLSLLAVSRTFSTPWQADWLQTGVVMMGTFPLTLLYFHIFSWVSFLTNLLAIPLFHLGVLGGFASLFGGEIPGIGPLLIRGASAWLKMGLAWIHFWAEKPWGYFYVGGPSAGIIAFYYGVFALSLMARRIQNHRLTLLRPLSLALWLLATTLFFFPARNPHFLLTLFSAGQNEFFHIQFPEGSHWLINAGGGKSASQARWIIAPFLRERGVNRLEGILLTDFSPRHTGGVSTLFSQFSIGSLLYPSATKRPSDWTSSGQLTQRKRTKLISLFSGDRISVQKKAGFQIVDLIEGHLFPLTYFESYRALFLPTWKTQILEQALPEIRSLPSLDVLIFPAQGSPSEILGKEILKATLPYRVVFSKRSEGLAPLLEFLDREEISYSFLSETGALQFEIDRGELLVKPYLGK